MLEQQPLIKSCPLSVKIPIEREGKRNQVHKSDSSGILKLSSVETFLMEDILVYLWIMKSSFKIQRNILEAPILALSHISEHQVGTVGSK